MQLREFYYCNPMLLIKDQTAFLLLRSYKALHKQIANMTKDNGENDPEICFLNDLRDAVTQKLEEFGEDTNSFEITTEFQDGVSAEASLIILIETCHFVYPYSEEKISLHQVQEILDEEECQQLLAIASEAFLQFFETITQTSRFNFAFGDLIKSISISHDIEEDENEQV